jgi:PAS domain S-box-containing protein
MGAWEWDITSGEFFGSTEFEAIRGLAPGSFGGRFSDFKRDIHRDDVESVLAEMQRTVDARRDYRAVYRLQRPDGEQRWVEAFGKIALGADGRPQKLAGICVDITERKRHE